MDDRDKGSNPGTTEAVPERDDLFWQALDALPFPACIVDAGGRVIFSNRAAARVFLSGTAGEKIPAGALDAAGETLKTGIPSRRMVSLPARDGREVRIPCEAVPLSASPDEKPRGVLLTAPVTGDADPLLETLVREISRMKLRELLSVIRHDILNQLTILIGFLQYSEELIEDAQIREFIAREENAGKVIQSLIEFTRKFQDLATHEPAWMDLSSVVTPEDVHCLPRDVAITIDCGPFEVFSSPLLATVFSTLIGNALDHATGLSRITVTAREDGDDLVIAVEDDGPGIPEEEKKVLFERGHGRQAGYSLWLAREIVSICGGTIRECGEKGKGARFEIRMPAGLWRRKKDTPTPPA